MRIRYPELVKKVLGTLIFYFPIFLQGREEIVFSLIHLVQTIFFHNIHFMCQIIIFFLPNELGTAATVEINSSVRTRSEFKVTIKGV